ncbi:PaaI family thioesterase [Abyssibius alkaniclasticus]|uniref:PaaI family thioesterase n=1 Tax=Abyssibius alkaniclasticus TaxID=2881234 RepID=UPI00236419D1|nr:PaaI family thioesterase [Abyssibius alkaniclasticus]UPH70509.1 PaaI family thioesterase [Abyssibius alkaniclasticus]
MLPVMTIDELHAVLEREFPQVEGRFRITALAPHEMTVAMTVREADLRPGGTVSGPTMFGLADVTFYLATMAMIGPQTLTVTTSCTINFMRKPAGRGDMLARARILKLGRSLSVGDVLIYSADSDAPVAHASLTYAIPPDRSGVK